MTSNLTVDLNRRYAFAIYTLPLFISISHVFSQLPFLQKVSSELFCPACYNMFEC